MKYKLSLKRRLRKIQNNIPNQHNDLKVVWKQDNGTWIDEETGIEYTETELEELKGIVLRVEWYDDTEDA